MTRSIDVLLGPPTYRKRATIGVFFGDEATDKRIEDIQRRVTTIERWEAIGVVATILAAAYVGRKRT